MKRTLATILVFLLFAQPAFAALSLVDTATHDQETAADPIEFTGNTTSGVNLAIVACAISTITDTVNTITHNGDAVSLGVEEKGFAAAASYIYYRLNPDIGTGLTVSVDLTPGSDDGGCVLLGFSGAKSTGTLTDGQTDVSGSGDRTSTSVNVTCPADGIVVSAAMVVGISTGNSVAASESGQNMFFHGDDGSGEYAFSTRPGQGGSTAIGYTWTGSRSVTHSAICINAEPEAATSFGPLRRRGQ